MEPLLTARQVSELLKISLSGIHKWVKEGKIEYYRLGEKPLRFRESDILEFIEKGSMTPFRRKKGWDTLKYRRM